MTDDGPVSVATELHYRDPDAALDWLARAFGFQTRMVVADDHGRTIFAESGMGGITVCVVPEVLPGQRSPAALGGANTQLVRIRGAFDVDSHYAAARAAGATIVQEPTHYFFGDRAYVVADLEGHLWSFAQRVPGAGGPPPKGWTVRYPSPSHGAAT